MASVSRTSATDAAAKAASHLLRAYFRSFPVTAGKLWVWDRVARPYLAWRPIPVEARTRSGLRLSGSLSDTIHCYLFFFGVWEPALTRYIAESLAPGDVFIDVGANVGVHTMRAAQCVGATGIVHAIEAFPPIFRILTDNLARNGITNVVTHNVAVSDHVHTVSLHLPDAGNLGSASVAGDGAPATATVPARPLPEIVPTADLLRAKMIKIDVEGSEWPVLRGLASLLGQLRADVSIVVEVDRSALAGHGVTFASFLAFFAEHGFVAGRIENHSAARCLVPARTRLLPVDPDFDVADLVFRRTPISAAVA